MIPLGDSIRTSTRPFVTWLLVAINVWVFFYELTLGPDLETFVQTWGFIPARYFLLAQVDASDWLARYLPVLTSMFMHGGWMHLIGNMVYLWIFGDNVEDRLGHLRFLFFYLAAGIGAALAHAYLQPDSVIPTVGASGAISGVLGGYLLLFPHARVLTLVIIVFFVDIIEVPAVPYLGFWFVMQLLSGTVAMAIAGDAGGVAWWAHVGGFVLGLALAPLLRRPGTSPPPWRAEYAP